MSNHFSSGPWGLDEYTYVKTKDGILSWLYAASPRSGWNASRSTSLPESSSTHFPAQDLSDLHVTMARCICILDPLLLQRRSSPIKTETETEASRGEGQDLAPSYSTSASRGWLTASVQAHVWTGTRVEVLYSPRIPVPLDPV